MQNTLLRPDVAFSLPNEAPHLPVFAQSPSAGYSRLRIQMAACCMGVLMAAYSQCCHVSRCHNGYQHWRRKKLLFHENYFRQTACCWQIHLPGELVLPANRVPSVHCVIIISRSTITMLLYTEEGHTLLAHYYQFRSIGDVEV